MTKIEFTKFEQKCRQDIFKFLVASGDTAFTLITPQFEGVRRKNKIDPVSMAFEYYSNVYVAYEICKVADTFECYIPDPESLEGIQLIVTVSDLILFTEYLDYCINGEFFEEVPHPVNGLLFFDNREKFYEEMIEYDYENYNAFAAVDGLYKLFNEWAEKH